MAGFNLRAFGGFSPRVAPQLLNDNEAVRAVNSKLYSGSLTPWNKPRFITPRVFVSPNTRTIYRVQKQGGDNQWFAWNTDVNIVKGPLTDGQAFRLYYTGDGTPRKTNATLAGGASGGAPADYLSLGVPNPVDKPSVTLVGSGTTSAETRVYVVTHISTFGDIKEESGPSPVSDEITVYSGDSVTVGNLTPTGTYSRSGTTITVTQAAHGLTTGMIVNLDFTSGAAVDGVYTVTVTGSDTFTVVSEASGTTSGNVTILYKAPAGKYNITHRRIYRSVTGTSLTSFQFVDEVPVTQATYSDTKTSAQVAEVIKTLAYTMPPNDLKGLVEMPNGILAGFVGKEIYFSEAYRPHAWPDIYSVSIEHEIVGLGVYGQSLVVMTKGNPYVISGIEPGSMSSEKISIIEPCMSARTIASDSMGVTYASPNGLVEIGPAGAQIITRNVMTKDEFLKYSPLSSLGVSTQGKYFMFYESADDQFPNGALIFDRSLAATPLTQTTLIAIAAWVDQEDANLYIVEDGEIKLWEGDAFNALPFEWTSKEFILPQPVNLGAIEIYADFGEISSGADLQDQINQIIADNQAIFGSLTDLKGEFNDAMLNVFQVNGSVLGSIPQTVDDRFIEVIVYAEGKERQRITATERGVKRLVDGYKSDRFQFTLSGNVPLRHVKVAETVKELRSM
jgi:hypothetical protein